MMLERSAPRRRPEARGFAFLCGLLAVALAGCSGTRLSLKDDPVFQQGQARLAKTLLQVDVKARSKEENALFGQAEAFYDYRFSFPSRTGLGQLAQIAAVITDFPALQSLAGSMDLLDRRLGAYDSAAQLWEGFLDAYPQSPLRPLALYRLGWAYRSVGAQGLKGSSDEAFAQLKKDFGDPELAALAAESQAVPYKTKGTATLLSLIPGAGQVYVHETSNGLTRFGIALAGLAVFLVPTIQAYQRREDLHWPEDWPLALAATGGLVVLSVDYTLAYQDAMRGVVSFNEAKEDEFLKEHPEAP
jgi:hypothetical protein